MINSSKYVIKARQTLNLGQTCRFFTCLESQASFVVHLEYGGSVPFWAGAFYQIPDNTADEKNIRIENTNDFDIEILWAWGRGIWKDQTLKVFDDVATKEVPATSIMTEEAATPCTLSIPVGTRSVTIQNVGTADVRIGEAGFIIKPDGHVTFSFYGDLPLTGTSRVTVTRLS